MHTKFLYMLSSFAKLGSGAPQILNQKNQEIGGVSPTATTYAVA